MWFKIISMEEFESYFGTVKIGDEIDSVQYEDKYECLKYIEKQYGIEGENIKVKIMEVLE